MTENLEIQRAYQTLTDVLHDVNDRGTLPAGLRGRMYTVVDVLRREGAPYERVRSAERIGVTLYSLEWARLRKNEEQESSLWRELQELGSEWIGRTQPEAVAG
jgi:hypothetical protein